MPKQKEIVCVGDCTIDEFVKLIDASVHCNINHRNCELCVSYADKIPYESLTEVPAVGNAANVSVGSSRLGHKAYFVSAVGGGKHGKEILRTLKAARVDTRLVKVNKDKQTNVHFVLNFKGERTILIKHEKYEYPKVSEIKRTEWLFFSSIGEGTEKLHNQLATFVKKNKIKMGFNPGTFQMKMGRKKLAAIYKNSYVIFLNREEAQRVLGAVNSDIKFLTNKLHGLGPQIVCITDGPEGAYVSYDSNVYFMSPYPDPAPPLERTGAGDSFSAGFMAALMYGLKPEEAIMWAPINSMNVVQHIGAQKGLLTKKQLLNYLKKAPKDYKPKKL